MLVSLRMPTLALLLLMASVGCTAEPRPEQDSNSASPEPTAAEPTPLTDYDTSDLTLVRASFCGRVADSAIAAALAGEPSDQQTWRPGGRLPDSKDIGNEFGCSWTAGPVTARAWVFAPPLTAQRAEDLAREIVGDGCRRLRDASELGTPSVAQRCGAGSGRTGIYGLVGDTWVSCEISGRAGTGDIDLVGEWCVGVLEALRGT